MASARYWRLVEFLPHKGRGLELSEVHLYSSGVLITAPATITSHIPPTSGVLGDLSDDDTATSCTWADVSAPSFALMWDFGIGVTQAVSWFRLGSGPSKDLFPENATLQYSSDGSSWFKATAAVGLVWPGANTLTLLPSEDPGVYAQVALLLHMNGSHGSSSFPDGGPQQRSALPFGGASISTADSKFGGASVALDGVSKYLSVPSITAFDFADGDMTISLWFNSSTTAAYATLICREWSAVPPYPGGWTMFLRGGASGPIQVWWADWSTGAPFLTGTTTSHNDGNWHHVAWTKEGGVHRLFFDGVQEATATTSVPFASVDKPLSIGADLTFGSRYMGGFVDEVMLLKGVALWTSNFTPPATASFTDPTFGGLIGPSQLRTVLAENPEVFYSSTPASGAVAVTDSGAHHPYYDYEFGGSGQIAGFVERDSTPTNIPVMRRVRLFREGSGLMVRETWSDPVTGAYVFPYIAIEYKYTVIAYDYVHDYRAVVADNITPEPMP